MAGDPEPEKASAPEAPSEQELPRFGNYVLLRHLGHGGMAEVLIEATTKNYHLPIDFAVGTMCEVCAGLHYAHSMRSWEGEPLSIVHREKANSYPQRQYLSKLIENVGRDIEEACRISGLSRSRLYALLKKHEIPLPR